MIAAQNRDVKLGDAVSVVAVEQVGYVNRR